jgi:5-methylcytosine-specific restriction endonuclease McrA
MLDTRLGVPLKGRPQGGKVNAYTKRIHHSARWLRVRLEKLERDPLCQRHAHRGQIVRAVDVDHWRPLDQGGAPYDDDNLVSLCRECHGEKTQAEQSGTPLFDIVPSTLREYTIA